MPAQQPLIEDYLDQSFAIIARQSNLIYRVHRRLEDKHPIKFKDAAVRALDFGLYWREHLALASVTYFYDCSSGIESVIEARERALKARIIEGEQIERHPKTGTSITSETTMIVTEMLQDKRLGVGLQEMIAKTKLFIPVMQTDFADAMRVQGFFSRAVRHILSDASVLISHSVMNAYTSSDTPKPSELHLDAMRKVLESQHIKPAFAEFAQAEHGVTLR